MSYLDVPRIHVAGRFFADPSTVNNNPANYDPKSTRPTPWQNPMGEHEFRLVSCAVTAALDDEGKTIDTDPIIGTAFSSIDTPSSAKIVDLDVYQQGTSTLYGLQVRLEVAGKTLNGRVDPAVLNGIWFKAVLPTRGWGQFDDYGWSSYGGDTNAAGSFQTLIRIDASSWPDGASSVLDQLKSACDIVDGDVLVSFGFELDGYENVPRNKENVHYGRFVGTLGPGKADEASSTPAYRWLVARADPTGNDPWFTPALYGAPFLVDEKRKVLVLNLANSISREEAGGPPVDLGTLSINAGNTKVGELQFNAFLYNTRSGICEVQLTDAQIRLVANSPISLITSRTDIGNPILFAEAADGFDYSVNDRSLRMTSEPGSRYRELTTKVYVRRFGRPVANVQLELAVVSVTKGTAGATVPPIYPGNTEQAEGALAASITPTDADGIATVILRSVKDPGSRTPQLDGQLYFVYPCRSKDDERERTQERRISCLMWSSFDVIDRPEWRDIHSIMEPYVKLYPAMTAKIDLTEEHSFRFYCINPPWNRIYSADPADGFSNGAIPFFMTRDMTDPSYMPVSRDLSPNKVKTVLNFARMVQKGAPDSGGGSA
jgi:hypothetical protein